MEIVYFDNSATTKMSEGAKKKMLETANAHFGNPSSLHSIGLDAEKEISRARSIIAESLGVIRAQKNEIIFTSGGTESNNVAILGSFFSKKIKGNEKILTTEGEHASVEEPLAFLEKMGYNIVRVPTKDGQLDLDFLKANASGAILATFMHVNNETGALYDVKKAFEIVKECSPDAVLHSDCVQSYLKVKFTIKSLGADLISVSGHKVNGPKGVGALYISPEIIKAKKISPLFYGGGQESGLRSGTENVYSICAFAEAVSEHVKNFASNTSKMATLKEYIIEKLNEIDGIKLNLPINGAPHIINVAVLGIRSETVLHHLSSKGVFVSSGSACSSNSQKKTSRALLGFGLIPDVIDSSVRISLSPSNTREEADVLIEAIKDAKLKLVKR